MIKDKMNQGIKISFYRERTIKELKTKKVKELATYGI